MWRPGLLGKPTKDREPVLGYDSLPACRLANTPNQTRTRMAPFTGASANALASCQQDFIIVVSIIGRIGLAPIAPTIGASTSRCV